MDKNAIKEALRSGGDEYHYRDANCDIGGDRISESGVKVEHFVVKRTERGQGIASTLLDALVEVMQEDGLFHLTVEMGATESYSMEELEAYREEHEEEDPSYLFLQNRGFSGLSYKETFQWGLVVTGSRNV